jgi:hypothetical protein
MTLIDARQLRSEFRNPENLSHALCCLLGVGDQCFCGALATDADEPEPEDVCPACAEIMRAAGFGRCPYGGARCPAPTKG